MSLEIRINGRKRKAGQLKKEIRETKIDTNSVFSHLTRRLTFQTYIDKL